MGPMFKQCAGVALAVLLGTATVNAASTKSTGLKGKASDYFFKKSAYDVVESYTDNTVVMTIENIRKNVEALNAASQKFATSKSKKDLEAAGKAMKGSFEYFNKARIFRYGPSAHYDFDKQLATWPFDKVFVDYAIKEIAEGKLRMDVPAMRERNSSNRGLHTVKYLIFNNDGTMRDPAEITDAEATYLAAVTGVMLEEAIHYQASWVGTKNMSAKDQDVLHKAGKRFFLSYADEFKNPGEGDSRYFSISIPLQEIIGESMTVLEDMAVLIDELPKYRDPENIRYWDSITPFQDIVNQLKGVENSVMGGVEGHRGTSYLDLLAKVDEQLSERIKIALAHTIKRAEVGRKMKDQPVEKQERAAKLLNSELEKLHVMIMAATPLVAADLAVDPYAPYGSDIN